MEPEVAAGRAQKQVQSVCRSFDFPRGIFAASAMRSARLNPAQAVISLQSAQKFASYQEGHVERGSGLVALG